MLKTDQLQKIEKLVVNIFSFEFNVMSNAMDQNKNFVRKILPFLREKISWLHNPLTCPANTIFLSEKETNPQYVLLYDGLGRRQ